MEGEKLIAAGRNRTTETRNATRHAEMEAIGVLLDQWQRDGLSQSEVAEKFSKCCLYVTCEPWIMCDAALSFLVYGKYIMDVRMTIFEGVDQYYHCIQVPLCHT
ncbi:hypothetical protein ACOSP7_032041 [Xanthoceras sorbifolium]